MASDFETALRLVDAFGSYVELGQYKGYSGGNFLPNLHADRLGDENSLMNFSVLVHDSILQSALLHIDLRREAYLPGLLLEANNADLEFTIPEILNRRGLDRIWPVCSKGEGSGEA